MPGLRCVLRCSLVRVLHRVLFWVLGWLSSLFVRNTSAQIALGLDTDRILDPPHLQPSGDVRSHQISH